MRNPVRQNSGVSLASTANQEWGKMSQKQVNCWLQFQLKTIAALELVRI